jgi:hypothetical protein
MVASDFQLDTSNKFLELQLEEQHMETSHSTVEASSTLQHREPKPPPIHVHGVIDFKAMIATLSTVVPNDAYHSKTLANNTVTVYPHSAQIYRRIINHLKDNNIIFHTYQLKQERAYRIVIRDIHPSIPTQEIVDELTLKGHTVRNIVNIRHRVSKEPLPLFFIDLEPQPNNKEVYGIRYLNNLKIRIEPPRTKKTIIQCMRCQDYGHSKAYCNRPYSCVKCGQPHNTKKCTKPPDTPATCALCQGNHPANYKGCTVYKELTAARNKHSTKQPSATPNESTKQPTFSHNLTPVARPPPQTHSSPTYAQATYSWETTPQSDLPNQLTTLLQEFKSIFTQLLQQNNMILTTLTTLITKLPK